MPNHVTHKITFESQYAEKVQAEVFTNGSFDFEKLVPTPLNMYHGDLSSEDEKDFPVNWLNWARENWGTKWNAYDCSLQIVEGKAYLQFDTAWSVPYPILAAFCNKFQFPFEHRYFDEGSNFWGIEIWGKSLWSADKRDALIQRIETRKSKQEDYKDLAMDLLGYDPDAEEDDE